MFSAKVREKSIEMTKHMHILAVFLTVVFTLLVAAPKLWAIPFSKTKIIIEVNATAGDAGIQIFVDATEWKRLEVFDPDGLKVFDVRGSGSIGKQGVTELFFESAEPSFEDQPLGDLFDRFPEGNYIFKGTTVDGRTLNGSARLKHNIPAGPVILDPQEGEVLDPDEPVVISWTEPGKFPDTKLAVNIVGYQVIVERVRPQPLMVYNVTLPATVTKVTVSPEFLQPNADYVFEVLAIEASGNQTITEGSFKTQ